MLQLQDLQLDTLLRLSSLGIAAHFGDTLPVMHNYKKIIFRGGAVSSLYRTARRLTGSMTVLTVLTVLVFLLLSKDFVRSGSP